MLAKHPDKCRFPHGHTRRVECVLVAETLDNHEMVCDFKVVKVLVGEFIERFDHSLCMNTEDPQYKVFRDAYGDRVIPFEGQDPTTEVLAKAVYDHLSARLKEHVKRVGEEYPIREEVKVESVRVWETTSSWAEYFE